MKTLSRTIDKLNKKYIKESTENEAMDAVKSLLDLFHMYGITQIKQLDSDKKFIVVRCPGGQVLISVHGFKNGAVAPSKHQEPAAAKAPLKLKRDEVPPMTEEGEEQPVGTDVNADPTVQQAQLNALDKIRQRLQQQKNTASQPI